MAWVALLAFPAALVVAAIVWRTSLRAAPALGLTVAAVGLIFGAVNGCGYKPALKKSMETRTFTVRSKERTGGDNGKYLVFTDRGVFSVEDSLWLWKFDASDRYNGITVGHRYSCTVAGWRIHFSSDYENLVRCRDLGVAI